MRDALLKISREMQNARTEVFANHPLANFVRHDLRADIQNIVDQIAPGFLIKTSAGQGVWAGVFWAAIFNPYITESATKGYYPVYLFSYDGGV